MENNNWKQELEDGMSDMQESLREYKEIKQETDEGMAEMKEYNNIENKEEIVMNDNKEIKTTAVAENIIGVNETETKEVKSQIDANIPLIDATTFVAEKEKTMTVAEVEELSKKEKAVEYLSNSNGRIQDTLDWNSKREWSAHEQAILDKIKEKSDDINNLIETLKAIPKMKEIEKQLTEKPIANIRVAFADNGRFSVIDTRNNKPVLTDTVENIIRFLDGMALMQQA